MERKLRLVVTSLFSVFVIVAGLLIYDICRNGIPFVTSKFLLSEVIDSGRSGGIAPIMVSTFWLLTLTCSLLLGIGIPAGLYLADIRIRNRARVKAMRISLELLAGTPSIVFGLFGNLLFTKWMGLGFSILSGALTLTVMCLPFFIRTFEEGLSALPKELWVSAQALSISYFQFTKAILVRTSLPVLISALILAIGRALAETAALVYTSGYVSRMPSSIGDSGRALSVHIFDLSMNISGGDHNAYASATILLLAIFSINIFARTFLRWWQGRFQV